MKVTGCILLAMLYLLAGYQLATARDIGRSEDTKQEAGTDVSVTDSDAAVTAASTGSQQATQEVADEPDPDPEWEIVYSVWMEQLQRDLSDIWETA